MTAIASFGVGHIHSFLPDFRKSRCSPGNLVVAEFDHIETRELDPHLHTHAVVMNMTYLERGKRGDLGQLGEMNKAEDDEKNWDNWRSEELLNNSLSTPASRASPAPPDLGSWYSLLNDEIFKNKKFLGMVYQNYLALEVEKLGYQVEPKNHGQFEIKGFREQDFKGRQSAQNQTR